jgi:hypothetical protein
MMSCSKESVLDRGIASRGVRHCCHSRPTDQMAFAQRVVYAADASTDRPEAYLDNQACDSIRTHSTIEGSGPSSCDVF